MSFFSYIGYTIVGFLFPMLKSQTNSLGILYLVVRSNFSHQKMSLPILSVCIVTKYSTILLCQNIKLYLCVVPSNINYKGKQVQKQQV